MKKLFVFFIIFSMFLSLSSFVVSADETNTSDVSSRDKWIEDYQEFYNNSFDMPCAYYKLSSYEDGIYYYFPTDSYIFSYSSTGPFSSTVYETNNNNNYINIVGGDCITYDYRKHGYTMSYAGYEPTCYIIPSSSPFVFPCAGEAYTGFTMNGAIYVNSGDASSDGTFSKSLSLENKNSSHKYKMSCTVTGNHSETVAFSVVSSLPSGSRRSDNTGYEYSYITDTFHLDGNCVFQYEGNIIFKIRVFVAFKPTVPIEIHDQVGTDEAPIYYINDSGDIEEFNIVFVDHQNKLVYVPITNEYVEYKNITYDYDNFTYNFTTVNEENITLAFNEENITYDYGGNTYNYYYTVNNYNENPSEPEEDEPNDSDNKGIIDWLEKIYKAVKGIDSDNDIDVTINNITNNEEDSNSFIEGFKLKLKWIEDVYHIAQMLLGGASAQADMAYAYAEAIAENPESASYLSTGAPTIYLNLGNADSHYGYDYGGTAVAYDFSWYAPYKPTVDSIAGGFLWLLYLWGLVKHVPEILNGMGITENRMSGMVSRFLDDK